MRAVTYDEDRSQIRTSTGPRAMASLRNFAGAVHDPGLGVEGHAFPGRTHYGILKAPEFLGLVVELVSS